MRPLKGLLLALLAVLVLLAIAGLVWLLNPSEAEQTALDAALFDPNVSVQQVGEFVVLKPVAAQPSRGILFYPGMHVASEAYIPKLAGVVAATGSGIVIGRPALGIAFLSIGQADEMKSLLPAAKTWYVAGHSMGGAAACMYASSHHEVLEGVMLFGTYCGSDLSKTDLRVLVVAGSSDGLFSVETIENRLSELPPDTAFDVIDGMNHAQFANYGDQFGDQPATIPDSVAREALVAKVVAFLTSTK